MKDENAIPENHLQQVWTEETRIVKLNEEARKIKEEEAFYRAYNIPYKPRSYTEYARNYKKIYDAEKDRQIIEKVSGQELQQVNGPRFKEDPFEQLPKRVGLRGGVLEEHGLAERPLILKKDMRKEPKCKWEKISNYQWVQEGDLIR